MRILDDAENVAERVEHGGNFNTVANILNTRTLRRPQSKQPRQRGLSIGDTPLNGDSARTARSGGGVRVEAQLVATNAEANVERLVKVGRDAENL